jgi:hypothetical protein
MAEALYISGARIFRVGFSGMKMPIGIVESLMDNLMQRYLDFIAPELDSRVLYNKSVFGIRIVTPTECVEFFHLVMIKGVQKNLGRGKCT